MARWGRIEPGWRSKKHRPKQRHSNPFSSCDKQESLSERDRREDRHFYFRGNGSAIRAFVNSAKTLRVRYSFSTGFYHSSPNRLRRPDPNLGFHCVNRIFAGLARRGDPFSQPSGSSAFWADVLAAPHFEPKGADGTSPARLPPARFSWSAVLLPHAPVLASVCVHQRCAHPATGGTRKCSVPGRVHSVPKSSGSREARPPGANPFLTHGTVESPAKCS